MTTRTAPSPDTVLPRRWATKYETAAHLKCSPRSVVRMKAAGHIRGYRVGGLVRYDLNEVDQALALIPSAATPAVRAARTRMHNGGTA